MNMRKWSFMATKQKDTINSESGFALVASLLILAVMTIIGMAATTTSTIEMQIAGNENQYTRTFYNNEGVLINTMETPGTWLTTDFLTAGETTASYSVVSGDTTAEIRCIESTVTSISGLSDGANNLPARLHRDSPPSGSGYSMKHFEVHRYGITTTSASVNTRIQTGVWKVFNKSQ
ncbi:MAG: pilus assembly PilX N-terminal domain-containing protein [Deltaproteobacteria bacterium]|nr:pilus assembly PilX N-terminal domain-containing protein [Deltaproteobacteria bacterium]